MAQGGDVFLLDMGQTVRIEELARQMAELSGYVLDRDIPIQFTGLQPGEKLYEEFFHRSGAGRGDCSSKSFSILRASAGNDDHSGRDRSAEESNHRK